MAIPTKSAINECRDQLFLDRAVGKYLTAVANNIGIERPKFGFANDDTWRAVVRRLALDTKQIYSVFYDLLTIMLGPKTTALTVLSQNVAVFDQLIYISDQLNIPQLGTLILDSGLATEEPIEYSFRDPRNGEITLETEATLAHTALIDNGTSYLTADVAKGATSLVLASTASFPVPTGGDLVPIYLGGGTYTRAGTGDSLAIVGAVVTITDAEANFSADMIGKLITLDGATTLLNNGSWTVTGVPSATTLTFTNASGFTEAFPGVWKVTLAAEDNDEVVIMSANDIATSTLTVAATTNAHMGPRESPVSSLCEAISPGTDVITLDDTASFPSAGRIRITDEGGVLTEDVDYTSKDSDAHQLVLFEKLTNTYFSTSSGDSFAKAGSIMTLTDAGASFAASVVGRTITIAGATSGANNIVATILSRPSTTTVTYTNAAGVIEAFPGTWTIGKPFVNLLKNGESADVAQVMVESVDWDIFLTEENLVQILIPEDLTRNRLLDVSFLHDVTLGSPPSTTLSAAAAAGDTEITVVSTTNFPDRGIIEIDTAGIPEFIEYYRIDSFNSFLYANGVAGIPIGTIELFVDNANVLNEAFVEHEITTAIIDRGGTPETVTIDSIDVATNKVTLTAVTASAHASGDLIEMGSPLTIQLRSPLALAHAFPQTVDLYQESYAGTDLEDGRIFTATPYRYQGPYSWSYAEHLAKSDGTTLNEDLSGPLDLLVSQQATRTSLEVRDASLLNAVDYQQLRVGRELAGAETVNVNDITLRSTVSGVTLASGPALGATSFVVSVASNLPEASGYRLFLNDNVTGGNSEEIVIVQEFGTVGGVPNTVVIEGGLQYAHTIGDEVELVADVVTVGSLQNDHAGIITIGTNTSLVSTLGTDWYTEGTPETNEKFAKLEEVREYIKVVDSTKFNSPSGYALINHGSGQIKHETTAALVAAGAGTITVVDGSAFPAANFWIYFAAGTRLFEIIEVSSRTGNVLTLASASDPLFAHPVGELVQMVAGIPEFIVYDDVETGKLKSENTGFSLESDHTTQEAIVPSTITAIPSKYGKDYPFYLPTNWEDRLKFLFDLARAAGVEIEIISSR